MKDIEITDLMIGNYITDVWSPYGRMKITEIRKDKVYYGNSFKAKLENIRPIPLTENILLWFGFGLETDINGTTRIYYLKHFEYEVKISLSTREILIWVTVNRGGSVYDMNNQRYYLNNIKYLHELQNLVKILAKAELEIDERFK